MKRLIYYTVFLFLGTTFVTGQEQESEPDELQNRDRTRVVMVNGDILVLKDWAEMRLKNNATLNDGTVIHPDGTYLANDGAKFRLEEGECLDRYGIRYRNEYQYRYKVQQENQGLAENLVRERNQNREYYTLVAGEMYLIRNQSQNRLLEILQLGNGIRIYPDGSYLTPEQEQFLLSDGECMNMEGDVFMSMDEDRILFVQEHFLPQKRSIWKKAHKPVHSKKKKASM